MAHLFWKWGNKSKVSSLAQESVCLHSLIPVVLTAYSFDKELQKYLQFFPFLSFSFQVGYTSNTMLPWTHVYVDFVVLCIERARADTLVVLVKSTTSRKLALLPPSGKTQSLT